MENLRPVFRVGGLAIVVLISVAAGSCPTGFEEIIFEKFLTEFQSEIEDELGFTIHVLLPPLPAHTVIVPDTPGGQPAGGDKLECIGPCFLAMLDLMPRAHFAHPVVLAVYDLTTKELTSIEAEWWPYNPATQERYFHTVAERRQTLVCRPGYNCYDFYPPLEPVWDVHLTGLSTMPGPFGMPAEDPPNVWALIVNGYDDPDDSFDEDTDGIYQVLKGMGVKDDHICYLTDQLTDGRDADARRSNVENALKFITYGTTDDPGGMTLIEIKALGDSLCGVSATAPFTPKPASDFLFFYSSHGGMSSALGTAKVLCNHFKVPPGDGHINSDELTEWLAPVETERISVVIEACHSGGFLTPLEELNTIHGRENLSVFLSSAKDQSSFADIDPPNDKNPGDAGSETIWGFIEAFGTSSADQDAIGAAGHGVISFSEAVGYAKDNDATPSIIHDSVELVKESDPPPTKIYLAMDSLDTTSIETKNGPRTPTTIITGADTISLVRRCRFNDFEFDVKNTGGSNLAATSIRFHIEEAGETLIKDWDHAPTLILPGLHAGTTAHLKITMRAEEHMQADDLITLRAIVESPQSPIQGTASPQIGTGQGQVVNPPTALAPCGCASAGGP